MSESYWEHIEAAYNDVSIYDGPEVLTDGLNKYPNYVADLFAAHWFLSEMSNGGISQFFYNPTGILATKATTAFINLGLPKVAEALSSCIVKANASDSSDFLPPEMFQEEECAIYEVGGSDLGKIYDCMDSYAIKQGK